MVTRTVADLLREAAGLSETLERVRRTTPHRHIGLHTLIAALEGRVAEVRAQCEQFEPREDVPPCAPSGTPSPPPWPRPC
jgi:hypothetical protein